VKIMCMRLLSTMAGWLVLYNDGDLHISVQLAQAGTIMVISLIQKRLKNLSVEFCRSVLRQSSATSTVDSLQFYYTSLTALIDVKSTGLRSIDRLSNNLIRASFTLDSSLPLSLTHSQ